MNFRRPRQTAQRGGQREEEALIFYWLMTEDSSFPPGSTFGEELWGISVRGLRPCEWIMPPVSCPSETLVGGRCLVSVPGEAWLRAPLGYNF